MVGWLQLRGWKSKNNYPKGDSITEQNVAGEEPLIYPLSFIFFLIPRKKETG